MAGKRTGAISAALVAALLGLTGGCDRWWQTPPTPLPPVTFPTGDFVIRSTVDAEPGAVSPRGYDLSQLLAASETAQGEENATQLLATIRQCLPPNRTIELDGEELTAELSEREHAELARMLEDWRQGGVRQIVVETRFLAPDVAAVTPIAWNHVPLQNDGAGGGPIFGARITERQLFQLLTDAQGETRSNVLQAPKFTLLNGQSLTCSDLVATPFVTSVTPLKNGACQPVVTTVDEGFRIGIRPSTSGDGQIELAVEFASTEIGEVAEVPLPFQHPTGPPSSITVQAPDVKKTSASAVVRLTAGESFLICVPGVPDPKQPKAPTLSSFFVLTPRLLPDATSSASAPSNGIRR
ncbi:MAG TPA: hypothetical protein VGN57_05965 [Pirellulaceae bacterium]|jgi:hypothetical protein|nr:hypothetical protein [Pirellulaceae bacterium]